jgi:hypothetical protein
MVGDCIRVGAWTNLEFQQKGRTVKSIAITLLFTFIAGGAALGCREEGPGERAGRAIDEAGDDAKEAIEGAGDAAEDAREDAKDVVQ